MKCLWRWLTGRCTSCGQKLKSKVTIIERVSALNAKADRLATSLGWKPQTQSCKKCYKMLFEGEPGFVQTYLLIDMDYPCPVLPKPMKRPTMVATSAGKAQQLYAKTWETNAMPMP